MTFTVIPNLIWDMLRDGKITQTDFMVLAFLFKWKGQPGKQLGYSYIANGISCVKTTVVTSVDRLVAAGYIIKHKGIVGEDNIQQPNTYEINGGLEWVKEDGKPVATHTNNWTGAHTNNWTGAHTNNWSEEKKGKRKVKVKTNLPTEPFSKEEEEETSSSATNSLYPEETNSSVPLKSSKDIIASILNSFRADFPSWATKVKTKQPLYNSLFESFIEEGVPYEFVASNMDFIKKCLAPKKTHNKDWSDDVKQVLWVALATIDPNKKSVGQVLNQTIDKISSSDLLDPLEYYTSDEYIAKERAIRIAKGELRGQD